MKLIYRNGKWFCPNCNLPLVLKSEELQSAYEIPELVEGIKEWHCPQCNLIYNQKIYYDVVIVKEEEQINEET